MIVLMQRDPEFSCIDPPVSSRPGALPPLGVNAVGAGDG